MMPAFSHRSRLAKRMKDVVLRVRNQFRQNQTSDPLRVHSSGSHDWIRKTQIGKHLFIVFFHLQRCGRKNDYTSFACMSSFFPFLGQIVFIPEVVVEMVNAEQTISITIHMLHQFDVSGFEGCVTHKWRDGPQCERFMMCINIEMLWPSQIARNLNRPNRR